MWDARAVIVAVLAGSVSAAFVIAIGAMAIRGMRLTEVGGDVMIAVLGAVVAIVSGYIASYAPTRRPELKDEPPKDPADGDGRDQHPP